MSLHIERTPAGCRLHVEGEMTVSTAAALRDELLAALPPGGDAEVEVELSGVNESRGRCACTRRRARQQYA